MTTIKQPEITFTNTAISKIQSIKLEKSNPNLKLRLYIVGGGCSGFQYGFALEEEVQEDDLTLDRDNAIFAMVDSLSAPYLKGAVVDYLQNLQGARFVVQNPNAETTCGCGSSFSLKENNQENTTSK